MFETILQHKWALPAVAAVAAIGAVVFVRQRTHARQTNKAVKESSVKPLSIKELYLVAYNAASAAAWGFLTVVVISNGLNLEKNYPAIGHLLLFVQSFAILEIIHALVRIVRTPVSTTFMQVFSRLTMVWLVVDAFPEVAFSLPYTTMVLAWGITEIVRYSFYVLNIAKIENDYTWALAYCRYTFFYVLYPVGAGSEFVLMRDAYLLAKQDPSLSLRANTFLVFLCIWPVGFYIMYSHMIKQRTKLKTSGGLDRPKSKAE
ncbi:tyrosine phosphatase-like protein [Chytriomyces sp. MP71]|nr:tyrosine phosphatase-like protein [Chytriomyces sp. MP71]